MNDGKVKTEEIEKAIKEMPEPEHLEDVDMGLPSDSELSILGSERLAQVILFQRLATRASAVRLSITANKSVGNASAASKFENDLDELERQMAHCKRTVKDIDKKNLLAKARMEELAKRPPTCPRCGVPV